MLTTRTSSARDLTRSPIILIAFVILGWLTISLSVAASLVAPTNLKGTSPNSATNARPAGVALPSSLRAFDAANAMDHSTAREVRILDGSEFVTPSENSIPQTSEETRTINFDETDVGTGTDVRNRYPDIKFSSDFGQLIYGARFSPGNYVTSYPNDIQVDNHNANLYVDFPRPVKDLSFYVTSPDDFGTIFSVAWYRNNAPAGAVGFLGTG